MTMGWLRPSLLDVSCFMYSMADRIGGLWWRVDSVI